MKKSFTIKRWVLRFKIVQLNRVKETLRPLRDDNLQCFSNNRCRYEIKGKFGLSFSHTIKYRYHFWFLFSRSRVFWVCKFFLCFSIILLCSMDPFNSALFKLEVYLDGKEILHQIRVRFYVRIVFANSKVWRSFPRIQKSHQVISVIFRLSVNCIAVWIFVTIILHLYSFKSQYKHHCFFTVRESLFHKCLASSLRI